MTQDSGGRPPRCKYCESPARRRLRKRKHGRPEWHSMCRNCERMPWRRHRKMVCESCGFKAIHICQMDVDHIDGNRNNNDPSNFRTLCSNCHRLKSLLNGDHDRRYE